ncbi:hypothetical protein CKO15_12790 [Halorhodospira abdelmalekii]|uniref:CAP domain-containing protein n=1 Tax=Halorhodospira abdelmalekii TaxID=421629 RepID=UPI00190490BA|nr:CAP domain-containing protein [Halorhodospira abdelmalekii]MBK1736131.1 hypothetical protein [Halorhodospira abdelmalekii]
MNREAFDRFNDLFLGVDFSAPFGTPGTLVDNIEHALYERGDYVLLVKAAYAARGELTTAQVADPNLDLDQAMHAGRLRVEYWVERLEQGDIEPRVLLPQMLEEASLGAQGLNTDQTHIDFRQKMAEAVRREMEICSSCERRSVDLDTSNDLDEESLFERVTRLRKEVGREVAEQHEAKYTLLEAEQKDSLPAWYIIEVEPTEAVFDSWVHDGQLQPYLAGAIEIRIPDEVTPRIPSELRELLNQAGVVDGDLTPPPAAEPPPHREDPPPLQNGPAFDGEQPTAQETLMLELINRARMDPQLEAARLGIDLNAGIPEESALSGEPVPPLAFSVLLLEPARAHSEWMLDTDIFSHTGAGGSSPFERMQEAGYDYFAAGENLAWAGDTRGFDLTAAIYRQHADLFLSPGHRLTTLNDLFKEVGISQVRGYFFEDGVNYIASMVTQKFGSARDEDEVFFVTGVIYNDDNGDGFYSVGEGVSGVAVSVNGVEFPAFDSGGYVVPVAPGQHDLTFFGGTLPEPINYQLIVEDRNVKVDVVDGQIVTYGTMAEEAGDALSVFGGVPELWAA